MSTADTLRLGFRLVLAAAVAIAALAIFQHATATVYAALNPEQTTLDRLAYGSSAAQPVEVLVIYAEHLFYLAVTATAAFAASLAVG